MKKHITTLLAVGTLAFSVTAQSFQKMYGVHGGADQQVLYGSFTDDDHNLYASGTFRNIGVFPEVTFRGAVSKLGVNGELLWYKAYMPEDFMSMEGYFMSSIFESDDHNAITFGYYLGSTDETSGYYLQKIDPSGSVIWAKHIQAPAPDMLERASYRNGVIYVAMKDRIATFDENGTVLGAVEIEGLIARSLFVTPEGYVAVTGELYRNGDMYMPVIVLDQDLDFLYGGLYSTALTPLYGNAIHPAPSGDFIVLCNEGFIVRTGMDGTVQWGTHVLPQESGGSLYALGGQSDLKPIYDNNTEFVAVTGGFYTDDTDFQDRIVVYRLSAGGQASAFREISDNPFGINGLLKPGALEIDTDDDTFTVVGDLALSGGGNHFNYVHHGRIDYAGCGEHETPFTTANATTQINYTTFSAGLIDPITITPTAAAMTVLDIPAPTDSIFCQIALGIDDPQLSAVSVFPNPASDRLNIQTDGHITGPIVIRDASGRNVLSVPVTDWIDISGLAPGMYVVEMIIDGQTAVVRFMKN